MWPPLKMLNYLSIEGRYCLQPQHGLSYVKNSSVTSKNSGAARPHVLEGTKALQVDNFPYVKKSRTHRVIENNQWKKVTGFAN